MGFHFIGGIIFITKVLILLKSILFILFFVTCAFGIISMKLLPNPRSGRFAPMYFSNSFIVLTLMFRSVTHF